MSLILSLLLSLNLFASAVFQQKTEPPSKMVEFHMALLKKGPKWSDTRTKETELMHQAHMERALSLLQSGQAIIAGPLTDDGEIRGIYIFRAPSADDAKAWANADPAVASGHLIAEMHPWWSEDVMKKASSPIKMTTAYLAFLRRGPAWTPEKTAATEELQKAHLANIYRLAQMKKLVVAGPFGDDGQLRGIFVFRVDSLAEAKVLTETDPAVKAGRLALDLHPWQVPEGVLP
ncbi:MAG: hypothetical protein JWM21_4653 [Acidobacteria bacterium]|nr:hypothetical protein [Acidobacteriota bacterium]